MHINTPVNNIIAAAICTNAITIVFRNVNNLTCQIKIYSELNHYMLYLLYYVFGNTYDLYTVRVLNT